MSYFNTVASIAGVARGETPEGLPDLAPYLRAKYRMNDAAIREMAEHMRRLAENRVVATAQGVPQSLLRWS